jgi:hypothetical protein
MQLISKITKDSWFYEEHKEELEQHLGKWYVSYSTAGSFLEYTEDFVKQKLIGEPNKGSVYTRLGNFTGTALETGEWPKDNPDGFIGMENVDLVKLRDPGAEYEKLVLLDFGEWIFLGFIDKYLKESDGVSITDLKTGALSKMSFYESEDYTQVILYAHARELAGDVIKKTGVYFIERVGSHINPPLKLTEVQHYIPLEYNKERIEYAINKLKKAVEGIASIKSTYNKLI